MSADELNLRPAHANEADLILDLMRAFYAEDHLVFDELIARRAVHELLAHSEFGRISLLLVDDKIVGYAVATFGFSLEFHGRYLLLDEVYLTPVARGRGLGRRCLALIETWAREASVKTVRLEVNCTNIHARSLYLKAGYLDERRDVFTRWLDSTPRPGPA